MIIESSGKITGIDGDFAVVSINLEAGCGRCHEDGGCGGNNFAQMLCSSPKEFRVLNPRQAKVGDRVTVVIAEKRFVRCVEIVYGLPLLGLFTGAYIGSIVGREVGSIVGAACGIVAFWWMVRFCRSNWLADRSVLPYIK